MIRFKINKSVSVNVLIESTRMLIVDPRLFSLGYRNSRRNFYRDNLANDWRGVGQYLARAVTQVQSEIRDEKELVNG